MATLRKIFVDANVLIAGADSRSGASAAVLQMAEIGLYTLVVSRLVLDEAERNLRKKLPRALPNFARQMMQIPFEIVPLPTIDEIVRWKMIIEAKDAPILATAVTAQVDRFLTLNSKDFTPEVAAQSGLYIMSPGEFVQEIRGLVYGGL
jgi:predicted nucleic acid-binding protein